MTQQDIHDFMTASGFELKHGTAYYGHGELFFLNQAALVLQLTLQARRDEVELIKYIGENQVSRGEKMYGAFGGVDLTEGLAVTVDGTRHIVTAPGVSFNFKKFTEKRLAELNNQLSKDKEQ